MLKRQPYRNKKITEAARGESCQLKYPGCQNDKETVVWCHSPYEEDGHGTGRKADDLFGCFGCHHCHDILDGRKHIHGGGQERFFTFHRAMKRSLRRLLEKGVLT